jgi:mannose-6-phosphate isomerase-like protein (cupin superfamily)
MKSKWVYNVGMSYITNIIEKAKENQNFRTVLFTGERSQLVVMNIPVGGEIGEETHANVEQTIFILSGNAKAMLAGEVTDITAGDAVVVTPGTKHNIINTGGDVLRIYTVYAPANHIDGRIHVTSADAKADTEDEEFGKVVS